ncbi:hypothetical protein T10_8005 [Trichinella papuae]|uniref:Uncharacterized protein n=1 Tax=Trichinella papuae TaxID=268474 RepID=A0A0V1N3L5_9BILA|nr:hypothetical protein T10_8005 [Trichinella papuae]
MRSPIRMVLPAGDATGYCPTVYENQANDMAEGTGPLFLSLKTDSGHREFGPRSIGSCVSTN